MAGPGERLGQAHALGTLWPDQLQIGAFAGLKWQSERRSYELIHDIVVICLGIAIPQGSKGGNPEPKQVPGISGNA
jgi:hypothetical protein